MFNNPVNCSKLTFLPCRITEYIHLNSSTTNLSAMATAWTSEIYLNLFG